MGVGYAGSIPPTSPSARHGPARARRPSLALRLRVRWKAPQLDVALADGADPGARDELALRAMQLTDAKHRARIARSIDRLIDLSERGEGMPSLNCLPFQANRVEANRLQLMEVADRPEEEDPPPVKAVAMATLLVEDGLGPMYVQEHGDRLGPAVRSVLSAFQH
jgi:hypothetical protein